jgi:hypothetical protein
MPAPIAVPVNAISLVNSRLFMPVPRDENYAIAAITPDDRRANCLQDRDHNVSVPYSATP